MENNKEFSVILMVTGATRSPITYDADAYGVALKSSRISIDFHG